MLPLRARDGDQEPLQFAVTGLPPAATLTPGGVYGTSVLNWTPQSGDQGTYTVIFTVADQGNGLGSPIIDSETITLIVRGSNAAPLLADVLDKVVDEGQRLFFTLNATDPNSDTLTYSAENLPEGATLDPQTGVFDWTPTFNQVGDYANIKVIASDGNKSRFDTFTIFVKNVNRAPQIVPLAPQFGLEGSPLEFAVTAGDPDGDGLIYSASNLPAGALFNAASATFSWTPGFEQAGAYTVTFTTADPAGLLDTTDVLLRIDPVNRAPIIRTSDHSVRLGNELRFPIQASDPDSGTAFTFGGTNLPEGASINPTTGEFVWRPGPGQAGEYLVGLTASDGLATVSQTIVLRAAVEPPPPAVTVELTPGFAVRPARESWST